MYEIRNEHPRLKDRDISNGHLYVEAPGFKIAVIIPYFGGDGRASSAEFEREAARDLANDILELLKNKDYTQVKDCTGALTSNWAERATGVAA
jgi:hypothetical protein